MKFTCIVDIHLPRARVIEIFDNPDNLKEWQDGFVSFEHLTGEPGTPGATSKIRYKMGKNEFDLIETIRVRNLPQEFSGTYAHVHMTNEMTNFFKELSDNKTRWESHIHYTKLNGIMIKLMAFLFPSKFKKQVQKWMNQFKAFAEKNP